MRKLLLTTTALLAFGATAAFAELTNEQIVDMFPGAAKIQIQRGTVTTKVEVYIGNEKIEVTFDNVTDAEIKRETKTLSDAELADELDDSSDDDMDDDMEGEDDDSEDDDEDGEDDDNDDDEDGDDEDGDDDSDEDEADEDDDSDDDSDDDEDGDDDTN